MISKVYVCWKANGAYLMRSIHRPGQRPTSTGHYLGKSLDVIQRRLEELTSDKGKAKELTAKLILSKPPVDEVKVAIQALNHLLIRIKRPDITAILTKAKGEVESLSAGTN